MHVVCVVWTWSVRGLNVVCTWFVRGSYVVRTWLVRGSYLACTWFVRGLYVVRTWFVGDENVDCDDVFIKIDLFSCCPWCTSCVGCNAKVPQCIEELTAFMTRGTVSKEKRYCGFFMHKSVEAMCAYCSTTFSSDVPAVRIRCNKGHIVHKKCLLIWFDTSSSAPSKRGDFLCDICKFAPNKQRHEAKNIIYPHLACRPPEKYAPVRLFCSSVLFLVVILLTLL
jgi:hypothetical protein